MEERDNNSEDEGNVMVDGGKAYKGNKWVMFRRMQGQIKESFFEEVTFNQI